MVGGSRHPDFESNLPGMPSLAFAEPMSTSKSNFPRLPSPVFTRNGQHCNTSSHPVTIRCSRMLYRWLQSGNKHEYAGYAEGIRQNTMTELHTEQCELTYEGAFLKSVFSLFDSRGRVCDLLL